MLNILKGYLEYLDDVLPDVALLTRQLVADGALEAALVPTGGLPAVVQDPFVHQTRLTVLEETIEATT